jgi:lipoteichoic acid synthase
LKECRRGLLILATCAALAAVACARVPPPPYPLAFAIDVHSPRLLETAREISVPIVVVNTGQRAWNPATMHVSYHWLWLIPRELAKRSRTVPYQEGIRTDLGDRAIDPQARIALDGRLLPPPWPGLYWLQWDMVEEGVGWFAQVSPRQPRTLVLVLPPAAYMAAPLPLLVALIGLWALGRREAGVADLADVGWCIATLAAKPLMIEHEALLEPTAVSYWLSLTVAILVPLAIAVIAPRRLRPLMLLIVGLFGSLLILADVVYYRFFGDVLSAPAMLAAHQTGHLWESIRSLFTPSQAWLLLDWPFATWLTIRLTATRAAGPSPRARALTFAGAAAVLAVAGLLLSAPRVLAATPLDQMFRDRSVVEQLGPFGFHLYDGWNYARTRWMRPRATDAQVEEAASWLAARAPLRAGAGPMFGSARGRNLIVVQVESLQDFMVDLRVDGQEVMPFLRRWTGDSLRFTNVTDETSEGRTSDAEFTSMTSLLPLDHGAVAFRFPANHYVALPKVLAEHGYDTASAVAFEPGFWNRQVMHPSYGFRQTFFEPDFQMTEQIGWGLNDHDFLQQMVPRIERMPKPFAAWLITLSLHHPFDDFPERHKSLKLGALEGTSFGNYLHTMRFFDQALEDFKTSLGRDGLLDDSVLVVFGDHDAGFVRSAELAHAMGIGPGEAAWEMNDRIPFFVRVPRSAMSGAQPRPAGQTDFAPTLLALLGIDPAPLPYVGRNLLGAPDDVPVPRPYGDWLDARHLFLSRGADVICYDVAARRALPSADDCRDADAIALRERELSRFIVTEDLQARVRDRVRALVR